MSNQPTPASPPISSSPQPSSAPLDWLEAKIAAVKEERRKADAEAQAEAAAQITEWCKLFAESLQHRIGAFLYKALRLSIEFVHDEPRARFIFRGWEWSITSDRVHTVRCWKLTRLDPRSEGDPRPRPSATFWDEDVVGDEWVLHLDRLAALPAEWPHPLSTLQEQPQRPPTLAEQLESAIRSIAAHTVAEELAAREE